MTQEIINMDCVEGMGRMKNNSVDLVIADPPYGLGKEYGNDSDLVNEKEFIKFTREWTDQAWRILKPTGSIYAFMGVRYIANLYKILEEDFIFNSWIVWFFTQGVGKTRGFSPRHEDILFFTKTEQFKFNLDRIRVKQVAIRHNTNLAGANPGDVWSIPHVHINKSEYTEHPTQKPCEVIKRIVQASSLPGDYVVDPFSGSGTVAKVCKDEMRNCTAFEMNPEYIKIGNDRLMAST